MIASQLDSRVDVNFRGLGSHPIYLIQVVLVTVMALLLLRSNLLPTSVTVLMMVVRSGLQLLLLVLEAVVTRTLYHARVRYRHLRVGEVPRILQHSHRVAVGLHPGGGQGGRGGRRDGRRGLGRKRRGGGRQFRNAVRRRRRSVVNLERPTLSRMLCQEAAAAAKMVNENTEHQIFIRYRQRSHRPREILIVNFI